MKTALLVVSFGTTHLDTFEKTIVKTEEAIAAAFPGVPFYRAFTSNIVRSRLKSKYGLTVEDVEGTLSRIAADGYDQVLVQPTLLIPGEEYDRLCASIQAAEGSLRVCVGKPLLWSNADLTRMTGILADAYPVDADTTLLLMGHGTYHSANSVYERLDAQMREREEPAMRICTVEGTPSFADAAEELPRLPQKKVCLVPLLFVAGDHAKNDMAGDKPDSLRSILTARGLEVSVVLQGLGELPAIQEFYVEKAEEAALLLKQ